MAIIVGPMGTELTPDYIGANIVVCFGHGIGNPNPYAKGPNPVVNGWGLNGQKPDGHRDSVRDGWLEADGAIGSCTTHGITVSWWPHHTQETCSWRLAHARCG